MHQGLSYTILERISEKLKRLEDTNQSAYHICWEQSSALCSALEQDLKYMGGGKGWPCIVDLSFYLRDVTGEGHESFRAMVKYPGRFTEDIRVVVTGLIHIGRIDVKVRNMSTLAKQGRANGLNGSHGTNGSNGISLPDTFNPEDMPMPHLMADYAGGLRLTDARTANSR